MPQTLAATVAPLDGFPSPAMPQGDAALRFTVYGKPQPAGSKRAFAIKRDGKPTGQIAVADANPKAKGWQQEVAACAIAASEHPDGSIRALLTGPVACEMTFYVARPRGHYGTGRNADQLKDSAPSFPVVKPDALKLARGTEDAMTGIAWRDDAQVVDMQVRKRYGLPERCEVVVRSIRGSQTAGAEA